MWKKRMAYLVILSSVCRRSIGKGDGIGRCEGVRVTEMETGRWSKRRAPKCSKDSRSNQDAKQRAIIALEIYEKTTSSAHEAKQERSTHIICLQDRRKHNVQGTRLGCAVDTQLAPRQCPSVDDPGTRSANWIHECLVHSSWTSASQRLWQLTLC
jgi:hypothetical protein